MAVAEITSDAIRETWQMLRSHPWWHHLTEVKQVINWCGFDIADSQHIALELGDTLAEFQTLQPKDMKTLTESFAKHSQGLLPSGFAAQSYLKILFLGPKTGTGLAKRSTWTG
jgi:hypothetical protein